MGPRNRMSVVPTEPGDPARQEQSSPPTAPSWQVSCCQPDALGRSVELAETVARLRDEVAGLRRAMRTRELVAMAEGVLIERMGFTPEEAFDQLRRLSQETDTRLVEIAAFLVGRKVAVSETVPPLGDDLDAPAPVLGDDERRPARTVAAMYQLSTSLIEQAAGPDELAEAMLSEGLRGHPDVVVLMALEPDGGLVLAGQAGLPIAEAGRWRRIPPQMDTYATRVARIRRPVWLAEAKAGPGQPPLLGAPFGFAGGARAILPLVDAGHLIGVVEIIWPLPEPFDAGMRRYVQALAGVCARMLRRQMEITGMLVPVVAGGTEWFQAVLDTLLDSVVIMSAVRDDAGQVIDFRLDYANTSALDVAGRSADELVGHRLLELYPISATANGLFEEYQQVFATGSSFETNRRYTEATGTRTITRTMSVHAIRFLDGVLVTWRIHDDDQRTAALLEQAERVAHLGAWEHDLATDTLIWDDAAYRLFGLDPGSPPPSLEKLSGFVHPGDRSAFAELRQAVLEACTRVDAVFRVVRADGVESRLRIAADPVLDPLGKPGQGPGHLPERQRPAGDLTRI